MKTFFSLILSVIFLVTLTSCGNIRDTKSAMSESLLNEAEELIDSRQFSQAQDTTHKALEKLNGLILSSPDNIDYRLLRARGYMLLFYTKNTLILENATERTRSFIKMPSISQYDDFAGTVRLAQADVTFILNKGDSITHEQKAAARGFLASTYRLDESSADDADKNYELSILSTRAWLREAKKSASLINKKTYLVARIKKQLQELLQARAEVNIFLERWSDTLTILEETMAHKDLKYFDAQFSLLEKRIAELRSRLTMEKKELTNSREDRLLFLINKAKKERFSRSKKSKGYKATEAEIIDTMDILINTKNNLIYRIMCYHYLKENDNEEKAHKIMKKHYPSLDIQLVERLQYADKNDSYFIME
jgi:hypothetical protein